MKIGFRTPNLKKSLKARTTGKLKRTLKKSINPFYDKKGIGFIKSPKKSIYNSVYKKTTVGLSSEVWIHIILFLFTAGIGNIIYICCKKK